MRVLKCVVQNYAWGKVGGESEVANLRSAADENFKVDSQAPYAELWMGTHPNGPSVLDHAGPTLKEYIKEAPHYLGEESRSRFGDDLPFLFKVLSVGKALSIQAHPNIEMAKKLHAERPDIYKDPNHKPEMAIALTKFQGLCGFRPLSEIQKNVKENAELRSVIGEDLCNALCTADDSNYADALKNAFTALMSAEKGSLAGPLNALKAKISKKASKDALDNLFLQLSEQYPGDVGCLVIYFVNHVTLEPGQAMFLGPNLIHAYLAGDCIECMACSDNVVRAGLTPKLIDVPTLCSMLDYKCLEGGQNDVLFQPSRESDVSTLYNPPVPDFSVSKISVASSAEYVWLPTRKSASILICTKGKGTLRSGCKRCHVKRGDVIFHMADLELAVVKEEGSENIEAFQAFC